MGADALLIEVHPNPAEAWSDGAQQVSLAEFANSDEAIAARTSGPPAAR